MDRSSAARLQRERSDISNQLPPGCHAGPKGDNLFEWIAIVQGPEGTPYDGGVFFIDLFFPKEYPHKPPKVVMRTRIYHCNISANGNIALPALRDQWSPATTLSKLLHEIVSLLSNCMPEHALVPVLAGKYLSDPEGYNATARDWTRRFAR
eukprot:comp14942_c0_seq1/m.11527 comp14942_c0_seq1/g.11527  ORF comp14942_c0_seq1/g.11527 comp14942_c0_seq1/m.11527 type:complete len:151 (-) comp14942_c0_seq1:113-565(-)